MSQITTVSAIKTELKNYWSDSIPIDKMMIEACWCPKCHRSLEYFGRSTATEYRAYGVCRECDFAKLYQVETCELAEFKKNVCQTV